jgi:hypothetical protein
VVDNTKPIDALQVVDLKTHAVWEYTSREADDEILVQPVTQVPVFSGAGKIFGIEVLLASGTQAWAIVGNVDVGNPRATEQFISLSVEREGRWFMLSRYHDFDYTENGPKALARFLGLSIAEVFPISYDIRCYATGNPAALAGKVFDEPRERLSREQLIAMAVG